MMDRALPRLGAPEGLTWQGLGIVSVLPWLASRLGFLGAGSPVAFGLHVNGRLWPFTYVDATALWLLLPAALWLASQPTRRCARAVVAMLAVGHAWLYATESLTRYYGGGALAYDMSKVIQPLWRTATGRSMAVTWLGDERLWAEHGMLAIGLFAPFTRLFSDAGTGVLLAQAVLVAAWIPAVYVFARALSLDRGIALLVTCAAAASRSMQHAVIYDFHPECAFPLLLLGGLAARERARLGLMACCLVLAALLKEMAALTVGMATLYLALSRRDRTCMAIAAATLALGAADVLVVPKLSGTVSYLGMYSEHRVDYALALETTAMRSLSTMFLGWLHPFAWFAGAPWAAAAGLSGKFAVKGILFQYGFLPFCAIDRSALSFSGEATRVIARTLA